ncbi:GNAT family N-acetyltransferase [archaeon]|nr:GNAT family N-acetyltransferase [archaeon]
MDVKLKKLALEHTKELQLCLNNKDVVKTLTGIKFPFTLNASTKYIKNSCSNKDTFEFAIFFGENLVGTVVLENPNSNKKIFEVGYFITKEYWGKGIATKALKQILIFAFKDLKLKKVWAAIISNNPASGRVLEKAGFKLEGKQEKQVFQNNRYYDELLYGFLRA